MTTKVQIISLILGHLGHKPILTLDEDDSDELTIAAEQSFDFLLGASLSANDWRFASRISQLTCLVETPPPQWNTVWQLPAGYLKNIKIYPHRYDYEIYEDQKIYAAWGNTEEIWMEHIFQPVIERLPPWFIKYFIYEVSSYLALANAKKTDFFSTLESKKNIEMAISMGIDAQNRPNQSQVDFPMLNISSDNRGY